MKVKYDFKSPRHPIGRDPIAKSWKTKEKPKK